MKLAMKFAMKLAPRSPSRSSRPPARPPSWWPRFPAGALLVLWLTACATVAPPQEPTEPPAAPSEVAAVAGAGFVELSWRDNADSEQGFWVYREVVTAEAATASVPGGASVGGVAPQALERLRRLPADTTVHRDEGVQGGTAYRYAVTAFNGAGESSLATAGEPVVPGAGAAELLVLLEGEGAGRVTSVPEGIDCGTVCGAAFERGATVLLRAEAGAGAVFVGWSGACAGSVPECQVTVEGETEVVAEFAPNAGLLRR